MNATQSDPRDLELKTDKIETSLPLTFRHRPVHKPKVLVLFLHGYTDHSGSFLKRLFKDRWSEAFASAALLAPNGPFPVPVRSDSGWREAYAWFFYDEREKTMVISPETAVLGCEKLISQFGYESIPKILVGFSQGGFLAPHLAKRLKNVVEIIGIGTGFREDGYPAGSPWKLSVIHGTLDEVFPIEQARQSYEAIRKKGFDGEFYEVPDLKHVASPEVGSIILERIKTYL